MCGIIADEDLFKEITHFFEEKMAPAVLNLHKGRSSIVAAFITSLCAELQKLEIHEVMIYSCNVQTYSPFILVCPVI